MFFLIFFIFGLCQSCILNDTILPINLHLKEYNISFNEISVCWTKENFSIFKLHINNSKDILSNDSMFTFYNLKYNTLYNINIQGKNCTGSSYILRLFLKTNDISLNTESVLATTESTEEIDVDGVAIAVPVVLSTKVALVSAVAFICVYKRKTIFKRRRKHSKNIPLEHLPSSPPPLPPPPPPPPPPAAPKLARPPSPKSPPRPRLPTPAPSPEKKSSIVISANIEPLTFSIVTIV